MLKSLLNSSRSQNLTSNLFAIIAGALTGYVAWGHGFVFSILSIALLFAYLRFPRRLPVFLFALSYYLSASRGLLIGTMHYYEGIKVAFVVWFGAAFLSSLAWFLIWHRQRKVRYLLLPVVLLLISVPPIGYINWVNPLISAGTVFQGVGWYGFGLLLAVVVFVDLLFDENRLVSFGIVSVVLLLAFNMPGPKIDNRFASVRSHFDYATGHNDFQSKFFRLEKFVSMANDSNRSLVVLPENALGIFSELDMMVLDGFYHNKTIFAGANIDLPLSKLYANVLMQFKNGRFEVVYWQRVPVPVSMWGNGARAYLFKNPVVNLEDIRAGVFICYEQLIALTYAQTFLNDPQVLIGVSNLWWAKSTSIESIQLETIQLWSALFGVPYVFSVNE